ncbi:hypothetical protein LSAT2_015199 [Lamellibrachia satsuma]|nr:hypothetical protein LSAT2_015199 [Lamellibrachia satsuma]
MNIALGKPAFMCSAYDNVYVASNGNDGSKSNFFTTGRGNTAWWAVDFGGGENPSHRDRLQNFTVGLTDVDPRIGSGPINSPFLKCATHGRLARLETVSLMCRHPLYARRRYLFVAASVKDHFHLAEVEVFNAAAPVVASAEGFREFGECAVFTDRNQDTCEAVTSSDNPLDFVLRANLTQYQTNFDARITLRDGNCGDSNQVHVYTEEKPLNAGPFDGFFRRCQVTETEPPVNGVTVCTFECGDNKQGCDYVIVRVFGRYGPVRSLCEIELIFN